VQDGLEYLAEVQVAILETAWNYVVTACEFIVDAIQAAIDAFLIWIQNAIKWAFEKIIDPIVNVIKGYLAGIETAMRDFFTELAKWDVVDGDESVERTEKSGLAMMLSFIGCQGFADTLMGVFNFVGGFLNLLSPSIILDILIGALGTVPGVGDFINNLLGAAVSTFVNLIFGSSNSLFSLLGLTDKTMDVGDISIPTFTALRNFVAASGLGLGAVMSAILDSTADVVENGSGSTTKSSGIGNVVKCTAVGYAIAAIITAFLSKMSGAKMAGLMMEIVGLIAAIPALFLPDIGGAILSCVCFGWALAGYTFYMFVGKPTQPLEIILPSIGILLGTASLYCSITEA